MYAISIGQIWVILLNSLNHKALIKDLICGLDGSKGRTRRKGTEIVLINAFHFLTGLITRRSVISPSMKERVRGPALSPAGELYSSYSGSSTGV